MGICPDKVHGPRDAKAFQRLKEELLRIATEVEEDLTRRRRLISRITGATQFCHLFKVMQEMAFDVDGLVELLLYAYTGLRGKPFTVPLHGWST